MRTRHEVVGYLDEGVVLCAHCAPEDVKRNVNHPEAEISPVLLDECEDMTCELCGERLDEQ